MAVSPRIGVGLDPPPDPGELGSDRQLADHAAVVQHEAEVQVDGDAGEVEPIRDSRAVLVAPDREEARRDSYWLTTSPIQPAISSRLR